MAKKKMGLFSRLIVGTEKSEDYVRTHLPTTRWQLFWDILKGNLVKMIGLNILILVTLAVTFMLMLLRSAYVSSLGQIEGFTQGFGVGYPAVPDLVGKTSQVVFESNVVFLKFLPLTMLITSLGLSGGAYVLRNFAWGEGVFVAQDFIRGIKKNYLRVLIITVLYSIMLCFLVFLSSYTSILIDANPKIAWIFKISKFFIWFFVAFFTIMALYMITMTVTYELKFRALLKNAFLLTLALLPLNAVMLLAMFIPFVFLLFGGLLSLIGLFFVVLIAVSISLLIWTVYSHWVFDNHINTMLPEKYRNRGLYEKQSATDKDAIDKYKQQKIFVSDLTSRPIKPIDDDIVIDELPATFSRADIERLNAQKEAMRKDNEEYVKEHYNDERYVYARQQLEKIEAEKKANDENERLLEMTRLELEGKKKPNKNKGHVSYKKKKKK